jgi:hypothetical protein
MQYPTQTFGPLDAAGSSAIASRTASVSAMTASGLMLATILLGRSR